MDNMLGYMDGGGGGKEVGGIKKQEVKKKKKKVVKKEPVFNPAFDEKGRPYTPPKIVKIPEYFQKNNKNEETSNT
jgi:hypothetical protein